MSEQIVIPGIACPACGRHQHKVVETLGKENCIRRKRECKACKTAFLSYEFSEVELPSMSRQPRDAFKAIRSMVSRIAERLNAELKDE